jgi:hypothetical protein
MKYDPQQRPTASQTLQYPYFQVTCIPAFLLPLGVCRLTGLLASGQCRHGPSGQSRPAPALDLHQTARPEDRIRAANRGSGGRKEGSLLPLAPHPPTPQSSQKEALLDGNELSLAPPPSILHDSAGQPRVNSTYVNDRLAGEPRQGHPTNIPLAAPNIAPSNPHPSSDPLHDLGLGSK